MSGPYDEQDVTDLTNATAGSENSCVEGSAKWTYIVIHNVVHTDFDHNAEIACVICCDFCFVLSCKVLMSNLASCVTDVFNTSPLVSAALCPSLTQSPKLH